MTLRLEVNQLPLRDLPGFFPEYPAEQLIATYAIFGGVPGYLTLCDPHASLRENVINLLLTETGTFIDESNILLQSEFAQLTCGIRAASGSQTAIRRDDRRREAVDEGDAEALRQGVGAACQSA